MRRTEARQGVRMLKFMDVFGRWEASEVSQLEAAELLGMGERSFRRWCRRYEEEGEVGLLDRRIGKVSGKRVPPREHVVPPQPTVEGVGDCSSRASRYGERNRHLSQR